MLDLEFKVWDLVITGLLALAVAKISHWLHRWQNPKCNGKLPPGDMGFPIIGKVFELFKPHPLYDVLPFAKKQMLRYGPLSRTNFLGFKTIISTDPEINHEIFKEEDKSFVIGYPEDALKMFGETNLFMKQGNIHKYIKNVSLQLIGPESLRKRLIHEMDILTLEGLEAAAGDGPKEFKKLTGEIISEIMNKKVMHNMPPEIEKEIRKFQATFSGDFYKMAFRIAWRALRACIAGNKRGTGLIKDLIKERRASKAKHGDFIDMLVEEMDKDNTIMNEESAVQLIFMFPVLASDAISSIMAHALKFLTENPKVIEELRREHEGILQNREDREAGLTWEEYRSMTFTHMVLNETLRLTSNVPYVIRKAIRDVELKGYTIPAGWHVLIVPGVVHLDPKIHEDPLSFNPWRWENPDLNLGMGKHLMVFGGGARMCVGAQFSKLQMAIFLHHLVTKFRWTIKAEGEIVRAPTPRFRNGIHVQLSKNTE